MLQKISGTVDALRSVAVTSGSGEASGTLHETSLRLNGHAINMRTGRMLDIHLGDTLNIAVINILGRRRAVAWHALSTGAKGTIAVREMLILMGLGIFGIFTSLSSTTLAGTIICVGASLSGLAVAAVMAWVQRAARRLVA